MPLRRRCAATLLLHHHHPRPAIASSASKSRPPGLLLLLLPLLPRRHLRLVANQYYPSSRFCCPPSLLPRSPRFFSQAPLLRATMAPPAALPPLTPAEFRGYNRLAEHMNLFHESFRRTWTLLWDAASTGQRRQGMSIKTFLDEGLSFVSHLEAHHSIEETYIFPVLARRMPEFQPASSKTKSSSNSKGGGAAELLRQHREIHAGMEGMESYLRRCLSGEADLEMGQLKAQMETWGGVLWRHLDQEVETLGAENMRRYWTIEEIRRIPM